MTQPEQVFVALVSALMLPHTVDGIGRWLPSKDAASEAVNHAEALLAELRIELPP